MKYSLFRKLKKTLMKQFRGMKKQKINLGIRFYFEALENLGKTTDPPPTLQFLKDDYRQVVLKNFPDKIVFKSVLIQ